MDEQREAEVARIEQLAGLAKMLQSNLGSARRASRKKHGVHGNRECRASADLACAIAIYGYVLEWGVEGAARRLELMAETLRSFSYDDVVNAEPPPRRSRAGVRGRRAGRTGLGEGWFGELPLPTSGEPWFVASDVARVLGYSKPENAVSRHCKAAQQMTTPKQGGQRGGAQYLTMIPERDVYRPRTATWCGAARRARRRSRR